MKVGALARLPRRGENREGRFFICEAAMSDQAVAQAFTAAASDMLRKGMHKIEHCVAQLNDEQLWWRPRPEIAPQMNSIANLLLHLSGNMRQWIIAGVGGATDTRDRPLEFSDRSNRPKGEILGQLKATVDEAAAVISRLAASDLTAARRIQGYDTNVTAALFQTLCHFHGHVQEIIHLTREQLGERYQFDFVPKGAEQQSAR